MSVITVTNDNFEEEVLKSEIPVLLDFRADWCTQIGRASCRERV